MANNQTKFSPEVRERAVRLVREHLGEYASQWAAVTSIAPKIGCSPYSLLKWVRVLRGGDWRTRRANAG